MIPTDYIPVLTVIFTGATALFICISTICGFIDLWWKRRLKLIITGSRSLCPLASSTPIADSCDDPSLVQEYYSISIVNRSTFAVTISSVWFARDRTNRYAIDHIPIFQQLPIRLRARESTTIMFNIEQVRQLAQGMGLKYVGISTACGSQLFQRVNPASMLGVEQT